MDITPT
jgi:hypothetical protein